MLHVNNQKNRGICFIEGKKWKENLVNRHKHLSRHFNVQTNKTYHTTFLLHMIYNIHVEPI